MPAKASRRRTKKSSKTSLSRARAAFASLAAVAPPGGLTVGLMIALAACPEPAPAALLPVLRAAATARRAAGIVPALAPAGAGTAEGGDVG